MPATSLSLSRLLGGLGFKQQQEFSYVESIQPTQSIGDLSYLVPVPGAPECLLGGAEQGGPAIRNTLRITVTAKGGAVIDCLATSGSAATWNVTLRPIAQAVAFPLTNPVQCLPVITSRPGAEEITSTGVHGTGIAGIIAPAPSLSTGAGTAPAAFPPVYVRPGEVFEVRANTANNYGITCRVREIPEAYPAR